MKTSPERRTSRKAIASFVLGLCSLIASVFAGIPAMVLGSFSLRDIKNSQGELAGRRLAIAGIVLGSVGSSLVTALVLAFLAASWIGAMRAQAALAVKQQRDLAHCKGNLERIGVAIRSYVRKHGHFPRETSGKTNLDVDLSWRVAILPELGPEGAILYAKFHPDEPWDSLNNHQLLRDMPEIYRCPAHPAGRYPWASYSVMVAPDSIFPGRFDPAAKRGIRVTDITDGTSNTVLVLESKSAVEWTDADTRNVNRLNVGSYHPGGFNALLADGTVRFLENTLPARVLDAMITRAGGEVLPAENR